jgi:hypothetical protein
MVVPIVADGGPLVPFGLRANMEFLSAAVALALQLLILLIAHLQTPELPHGVRARPATSA